MQGPDRSATFKTGILSRPFNPLLTVLAHSITYSFATNNRKNVNFYKNNTFHLFFLIGLTPFLQQITGKLKFNNLLHHKSKKNIYLQIQLSARLTITNVCTFRHFRQMLSIHEQCQIYSAFLFCFVLCQSCLFASFGDVYWLLLFGALFDSWGRLVFCLWLFL